MNRLALAAERTFRARQAIASRLIAEGKWSRAQAEAKLRPWLAIAALAGADLAELQDEGIVIFPPAQAGAPCRLRHSASDICPRADALAELARARDAALDALPAIAASASEATQDLVVLAIHLGAPAYHPRKLEKAA